MNESVGGAVAELERLYEQRDQDPGFASILERCGDLNDDALAELIEHDGRLRIEGGLEVSLDRYLSAVGDLPERPDALDAAVDMSLRSMSGTGHPDLASVEALIARYPELETAIREAGILGNAIWSTTSIRTNLARPPKTRTLPANFGPSLANGRHRYELRRLLGAGAFGQVYLAADRQLSEAGHDALVAIKVLNAQERGPWERQRLVDEATKARRIDHINAVRVLDLGVSDQDEDFIVYEYVDGGDLSRMMRKRRTNLPIGDAVDIVIKAARGVHAAHMAGLVHCDLKPANIMLTAQCEPKVADFGIAIRTAESVADPEATEEHRPLGNLAFISPEQFRMEAGALTVPSDLYALGGLLCWLVTGTLPNGDTAAAIHAAHDPVRGRHRPPSMRALDRRVDADLDVIGLRAMALRPEDRFDSAAAFADDLVAWRGRESIPWTKPSLAHRIALWSRRKPALAAAAALIVALIASVVVTLSHLSEVARQRELAAVKAETAQKGLELEEQYRQRFRAVMLAFRERLEGLGAMGIRHEMLPQIWVLEWLYGPTLLGHGVDEGNLWESRLDVVRLMLADKAEQGLSDSMESLMWETALLFWLISEGEHAEAEAMLGSNRRRWADLLPANDPWHADIAALEACAIAARLSADQPRDVTELEATALALEGARTRLAERAVGTPLHLLVLSSLGSLCAPDLLDDPERAAALEREHHDASERISEASRKLKEEEATKRRSDEATKG